MTILSLLNLTLFKEEGRRKKEEGRGKREEGRRKREEGRGKKEEGRRKKVYTAGFLAIHTVCLIRLMDLTICTIAR
ncbi:hypothetical protein IQ269_05305 [Tychonema sp. LEGE 07199]|uniref:hypothetical protein n=1 Tax=unclassified Tychonema TaxID=2642144 RepID=UPI001881F844|nr:MULTISPECIES: hypothetical protein [unclassified Tychonema]MBE9120240.1 hypothetical protein [Tychonema sp. LEGE 07199]MBE9131840.1 hypothetical protein [Tychonema sp. LEGE 07196]